MDDMQNVHVLLREHEVEISHLKENDRAQQAQVDSLTAFMIRSQAQSDERDKTLKRSLTVLSIISILSPVFNMIINAVRK